MSNEPGPNPVHCAGVCIWCLSLPASPGDVYCSGCRSAVDRGIGGLDTLDIDADLRDTR